MPPSGRPFTPGHLLCPPNSCPFTRLCTPRGTCSCYRRYTRPPERSSICWLIPTGTKLEPLSHYHLLPLVGGGGVLQQAAGPQPGLQPAPDTFQVALGLGRGLGRGLRGGT